MRFSGFFSGDTIQLGDLKILDETFEEFTDVNPFSALVWNSGYDGAISLSPTWASYDGIPSTFGSLVSRGLIDEPVFSLRLPNRAADQGELLLGGTDPEFDGEVITIPLVEPDYQPAKGSWAVSIQSITFNTPNPLHFDMPIGAVAVLDSGWPFIFLPHELFRNVTAATGAKLVQYFWYSIPCERRQELPTMTFSLGGQKFSISAFDYTLEIDIPELQPEPGTLCILSFQDAASTYLPNDTLILSSPFLRGFYSVFDAGKRELGCTFDTFVNRPEWKALMR